MRGAARVKVTERAGVAEKACVIVQASRLMAVNAPAGVAPAVIAVLMAMAVGRAMVVTAAIFVATAAATVEAMTRLVPVTLVVAEAAATAVGLGVTVVAVVRAWRCYSQCSRSRAHRTKRLHSVHHLHKCRCEL